METFGLKYFLSVLALVFVVEGIPYFISPSRIKKWFVMVSEMSNTQLRSIGFISISIGMAILYLAMRIF